MRWSVVVVVVTGSGAMARADREAVLVKPLPADPAAIGRSLDRCFARSPHTELIVGLAVGADGRTRLDPPATTPALRCATRVLETIKIDRPTRLELSWRSLQVGIHRFAFTGASKWQMRQAAEVATHSMFEPCLDAHAPATVVLDVRADGSFTVPGDAVLDRCLRNRGLAFKPGRAGRMTLGFEWTKNFEPSFELPSCGVGAPEPSEPREPRDEPIRPHGTVAIVAERISAPAAITRAAVVQEVARHIGDLERCYNQTLSIASEAGGRLSLRFTIERDGRTSRQKASGVPGEVQGCSAARARDWRFPAPTTRAGGPTTADVQIELHLTPG